MAYYLVTARPKMELMQELRSRLDGTEIQAMQPFGQSLHYGLANAKMLADGAAIWEEEDYCIPPLTQERAAVLDDYFSEINV